LISTDDRLSAYLDGRSTTRLMEVSLNEVREGLMLGQSESDSRPVRALAACRAGFPPEMVGRLLDWKEFELFVAAVLRACGLVVEENVLLKRPRAQIDLVASGSSYTLVVDCKHWRRGMGLSALARCADAQLSRARRLRKNGGDFAPMVAVILTLTESGSRFVDGAAVVPVHTLRSFVDSIPEYRDLLEVV